MKRKGDEMAPADRVPPEIALGPMVETWARDEDRPPDVSD